MTFAVAKILAKVPASTTTPSRSVNNISCLASQIFDTEWSDRQTSATCTVVVTVLPFSCSSTTPASP